MDARHCAPLFGAFVLLAWALPAAGQTVRSGGADPRLMQQVQQLQGERAALQSENAKLKAQLEELRASADSGGAAQRALEQRAAAAEQASRRLAASQEAASESAARTRAQLDELVVKFRETAQALKDAESERNALRDRRQEDARALDTCRAHNAELLRINDEVLVRLENTGFWSKLAADEPFTRLKRIELENLASDYRARASELNVPPLTP